MPKADYKDRQFENIREKTDITQLARAVEEAFDECGDPRDPGRCIYPAWYLILILIMATMVGEGTVKDIAAWAHCNEDLLKEISKGKWGAPSYTALWYFLVRLTVGTLKELISQWMNKLPEGVRSKIYAIDGKEVRAAGKNGPKVQLVGLYATDSGILITSERVPKKKAEPIALPSLLKAVDIAGALVTMDAAYAHAKDLKEVTSRGADYLIAIKANQPTLLAEVTAFFEQAAAAGDVYAPLNVAVSKDSKHGRLEEREVAVSHDTQWLAGGASKDYTDWEIKSLIRVRRGRSAQGKNTLSEVHYASSRRLTADEAAKAIRGHWGIENGEHYVLDVVWNEDSSRTNTGHAAENLANLRRAARNLVAVADPNRGFAAAKRAARYCRDYLVGLMRNLFIKE